MPTNTEKNHHQATELKSSDEKSGAKHVLFFGSMTRGHKSPR